MKTVLMLLFAGLVSISSFAESTIKTNENHYDQNMAQAPVLKGHGVGNIQDTEKRSVVGPAGDFVRQTFISTGNKIIDYLLNHTKGQNFADEHRINVYALSFVLNPRIIILENENRPIDEITGKEVDAVFKNGYLYLYEPTWSAYIQAKVDLFVMVFHEMLRSINVFDEGFVISDRLRIDENVELSDRSSFEKQLSCSCAYKALRNYELQCIDLASREAYPFISFDRYSTCEKEAKRLTQEENNFALGDRASLDFYDFYSEIRDDGWFFGNNLYSYMLPDHRSVSVRCRKSFQGAPYLTYEIPGTHISEHLSFKNDSKELCGDLKRKLIEATRETPLRLFVHRSVIVDYEYLEQKNNLIKE